jgi:HK97 family phage portal protein
MSLFKWASFEDRSPFGDFWFEPISYHSMTGQRVGPEQAMRLAAVYACVSLLAKSFAVMPFRLWRPTDTGRAAVTDHWSYKLLAKRPNAFQNPFEFRQMLMGHLALRGNAFCHIIDDPRGRITDLIPMHPDRMKAELLGGGDYRYAYHNPDGSVTRYPRGEIWHLRSISSNGIMGMSPIELQRDVIGLGLGAQEYGSRFFANDGTPPGWIEHPGQFKDQTARDIYRASLQNAQTGRNRGKAMVLEAGQKYHPIEVKNSDAQYLESRRFTVSEIARVFGVPPHLVGDLDRATFSNIEQQSLEFVIYTMTPIAEAWEASIEYSLLGEDDELEPDFDVEALLRGDRASRADFYLKMFQVGAYSTNDVLAKEGENPVDGGQMRFRPVNLSPLRPEDAAKFPTPAPPKGGPPQNTDGGENRDPSARELRASRIAAAAAERIARKEQAALLDLPPGVGQAYAFYQKHASFVSEALAVRADKALEYCKAQIASLEAGKWSELETRERLVALALETA